MSLVSKLLSASGGVDKIFPEDVFSAYTYLGNGSTQTINNGIDLGGKGGLVWGKGRDGGVSNNVLVDTSRGATIQLFTNLTNANTTITNSLTTFNSDGFSLGSHGSFNESAKNYASWTFRKAPKFFDVVTYTGNNVAGRQIPHALGVAPGMVIVKATSASENWYVGHTSFSGADLGKFLTLNTTNSISGGTVFGVNTEAYFTVGGSFGVFEGNKSGGTYVAYLFAHDTSTNGIIQCGSFTTDGSGNATVNLGWEPQYLMIKSSNNTQDWKVVDTSRGYSRAANDSRVLSPNLSTSEAAASAVMDRFYPFATGFQIGDQFSTTQYIYLAIRRPNKPPTLGTQVYNGAYYPSGLATGTKSITDFPVDMQMVRLTNGASSVNSLIVDRLRGVSTTKGTLAGAYLVSSSTSAETGTGSDGWDNTGFHRSGVFGAADPSVYHSFKRSHGVFDVVCYTGTGVAKTEAHSLGVVPELMIVKCRSSVVSWVVNSKSAGADDNLVLNDSSAVSLNNGIWNNTRPTSSVFSLGPFLGANGSGSTYVAYLFATKAGISKIGNYTGNGSTQTIDCGFTTGARFFMVKAVSTTGNWIVADSVRGISSAGDPALYLNSTAAEVTGIDWCDPISSGIIVNQEGTMNANTNGVSYIYLAFA